MNFKSTDAGKIILINLVENLSTGYKWFAPAGTLPVLKYTSEEHISGNDMTVDGQMSGVPGTKNYYYKLTGKPGTVHLKFIYKRSWEKENTGGKEFNLTINVAKPRK